jgi:hypothetical protein
MEQSGFGDSMSKNKAAVRVLPTDFFGSEYFEPRQNLQPLSIEDYAKGRKRRLEERRRLVGF